MLFMHKKYIEVNQVPPIGLKVVLSFSEIFLKFKNRLFLAKNDKNQRNGPENPRKMNLSLYPAVGQEVAKSVANLLFYRKIAFYMALAVCL